jgi:ADP-ribosyl-[dinitrogen reductase] hydrolase
MEFFGATDRVSLVPVAGSAGHLALLACPGLSGGIGDVDPPRLHADLQRLAALRVAMLVTLLDNDELSLLGVPRLGAECEARGLPWAQCPITDFGAPGAAFETAWQRIGPRVHACLQADERVAIHCRAGLGRSGTVAARVLIERGAAPVDAITWVQRHRRGAIETPSQRNYLMKLGAGAPTPA